MSAGAQPERTDRTVDLRGLDIWYSEWPGTSPPVVFLHGVTMSRVSWSQVLPARGSRRAFATDARGHGESAHASGTYRFEEFALDAAAFLEEVVGEPAVLVGHSLGGMVTTRVAARHPDRVLAAVLVDPPLYVGEYGLRDDRDGFGLAAAGAGRSVEELIELGQPPRRARMLSALDPTVLPMILDGSAFAAWDTDTNLGAMRCPTLLLHGERARNSAIYDGELERAQAALPAMRIVGFEWTGHLIQIDRPEQFVATVGAFLDEVAPVAA